MLDGLQDGSVQSYNEQMSLPDLPPDFTFPQLANSVGDLEFAFEAKKAAMGPHIIARWGWDEVFQRKLHEQRYNEKPFFAIQQANRRLGTVSFDLNREYARLGEFYIFPELQGKGIGTKVLRHCLGLADDRKLPVRLEHLRWNPVGSLYRRWGFVEQGTSEIHLFMERPSV